MPRACASFASRASLAAFCAPLAKFAFLAFAGVAFCLAAVSFAFVFLDAGVAGAGQRRRLTYSALILELMIPGGTRMRTGRRTCLNGMTLESSD